MDKLSLPWRWLRAFVGGYFWRRCPRCGRYFGGYETGGGTDITAMKPGYWHLGNICCKLCPGDRDVRDV